MKQLIKDVLEDIAKGQPNLESEAAREMISNLIMAGIRSKGWYLNLNTINGEPKIDVCRHGNSLNSNCSECDEAQAIESWVCEICGKSTYEVDYDYLGSGTNHLGCELQIEIDNKAGINPNDNSDYYTGPDGSYEISKDDVYAWDVVSDQSTEKETYTVVENLGWAARDKQQKKIGTITKDEYDKLYHRHEEEG
jgi:hypothetical protein